MCRYAFLFLCVTVALGWLGPGLLMAADEGKEKWGLAKEDIHG
jgi:hypothetical protein